MFILWCIYIYIRIFLLTWSSCDAINYSKWFDFADGLDAKQRDPESCPTLLECFDDADDDRDDDDDDDDEDSDDDDDSGDDDDEEDDDDDDDDDGGDDDDDDDDDDYD